MLLHLQPLFNQKTIIGRLVTLITIFAVCLLLVVVVLLYSNSYRRTVFRTALHHAAISDGLFELYTLSVDVLEQPTQRKKEQWLSKFNTLDFILYAGKKNLNNTHNEQIVRLQQQLRELKKIVDPLLDQSTGSDYKPIIQQQVTYKFNQIMSDLRKDNNQLVTTFNYISSLSRIVLILTLGFLLVLLIFIGVWLSASYINPLKKIISWIEEIGKSQLNSPNPIRTEDEIGQVARALENTLIELEKMHQTVNTILAKAPIPILVIGKDKNIKMANESALNILETTAPALIGKSCNTIFCLASQNHCPILDDNQAMDTAEHTAVTAKGKKIAILKSVIRIWLSGEEVILESFVNISELKKISAELKQEKLFADALINSLPGIFYLLDNHGHFVRYNSNLINYTGYSGSELRSRRALDIIAPDDREKLILSFQKAYAENVSTTEGLLPDRSGHLTPFLFNNYLFSQGDNQYILGLGTDISQIQAIQRELLRSNKELEQFAFITSHDLQEPLRLISNYVQLLTNKYLQDLDETGAKYVHYVTDATKRVQLMIQDLLAYSRIGKSNMLPVTIDLNSTLNDVQILLSSQIKESGATIQSKPLPKISGIPLEMIQLFQNLIRAH